MSWLFLDDECSCFSFLNDILLTATKVQRITAVMSEVTWRRKKTAEAIYPVQLNSLIAVPYRRGHGSLSSQKQLFENVSD